MKLKNVPNILSFIRLLLVFVFAFLFFWEYPNHLYPALIVFIVAGITDVIDGYIARKYNCCSDLGKILDPLADKLMQGTAVISLCIVGIIPWWLGLPFVLKDLLLLVGGLFFLEKTKTVVVSSWYGKFAACYFYLVVVLALICVDHLNPVIPLWLNIMCIINVAILAWVFVLYGYKYSFFKNKKNPDEERDNT